MPRYVYMDRKSAITKNQLWLRKYWYTKYSRMKYRHRYSFHRGLTQYIFNEW